MNNGAVIDAEAEFQKMAQAKAEEYRRADEAGVRAAYEPLPGPLRDIFSVPDSIPVPATNPRYHIRPFYDIDFEWLSLLGHPLHKMMIEQGGKPGANDDYMPRGPHAWQIAWIMSRPVEEVEALLDKGGAEGLAKVAKAQFCRCQLHALAQIHVAIIQQLNIYFSGVINYGPPKAEGEQSHPPSGEPLTGSAG